MAPMLDSAPGDRQVPRLRRAHTCLRRSWYSQVRRRIRPQLGSCRSVADRRISIT